MADYSLTTEQEKAFNALRRAFKRCKKENIYLWDNYGTISAVNGGIVHGVCPDSSYDAPLDDSMVSISTECNLSANADDSLFVLFH